MTAKKSTRGMDTRQRVLDAACRVFVTRGYRDATIAQICEKARTNIAAVNYHFGGKRKLYVEVWHHLFHESIKAYPPDGGVPASAPPEERLRGRIGAVIHRVFKPDNEFAILEKEFAEPTGLLQGPLMKAIRPVRQGMLDLVRELVGGGAGEMQTEFCGMSIISQCFALRHAMKGKMHPHRKWLTSGRIEDIIDHITQFSLGGIREIRLRAVNAQAR